MFYDHEICTRNPCHLTYLSQSLHLQRKYETLPFLIKETQLYLKKIYLYVNLCKLVKAEFMHSFCYILHCVISLITVAQHGEKLCSPDMVSTWNCSTQFTESCKFFLRKAETSIIISQRRIHRLRKFTFTFTIFTETPCNMATKRSSELLDSICSLQPESYTSSDLSQ